MKLIRYPHHWPISGNTCVTIGNFDGVHLGHQALVKTVVAEAKARQTQSVVVTMNPLPAQYFNGRMAVEVLTPFKHKFKLLANLGVDVMCCLNFNRQLAAMSASHFYQHILLHGLQAQHVLVGDDFRFGAGRQGDFPLLQELAAVDGVSVQRMPSVMVQGHRVSSTRIREQLRQGHLTQVEALLGRQFNVLGRVAKGKQLGRQLGYPTINLEWKSGAFSLRGVYVVKIKIKGRWWPAVASVGYNPTVGGNAKRIEVHVLDFKQAVYGQSVEVLFFQKLRNEVEFDSLTALTAAIETDVQQAREYFANNSGEPV
ncbi:bifunctional riboflavin kinase/FAD synthetase [Marinicella meishanensis]|uniref:bifunctional riboflavin kinase/FAD synthetase n=1 Tax=Marinicella meishanensis TaxID=2873263 RepID=UPI001CBEEDBA|nr:bifunctional riboflavin kinase/FAD synthetase [Marinicella sp. NBU2979]